MGINAYDDSAGKISFVNPGFSVGAANGTQINGGFNFDLPLSTVAMMQNNAMIFTKANADNALGFVGAVSANTQKSVDATGKQGFDFLNTGLGSIIKSGDATTQAIVGINATSQQFSIFRSLFAPKASQGKSSSCYITTAITESEGKPDDCDELVTLRKFRDEYMMPHVEREWLVRDYYALAPIICRALKQQPDGGKATFATLRRLYLEPAIAAVKAGDNEAALVHYQTLVAVSKTIAGV